MMVTVGTDGERVAIHAEASLTPEQAVRLSRQLQRMAVIAKAEMLKPAGDRRRK